MSPFLLLIYNISQAAENANPHTGKQDGFSKNIKNFSKNTCKVMYLDVHYTSGYRTVIMINALKINIESKNPALPIYRRLAEELRLLIISGGIEAERGEDRI